jgi:hypothetical protein
MFSDGSCGGLLLRRPGFIQYVYRSSNEEPFEVAVAPIPVFMNKLGVIVEGGDFILNILDSTQELLLVNSSPKTNFNLVKLIAYDENLERICERSKSERIVYHELKNALESRLAGFRSVLELNEYVNTVSLEQSITVVEQLLPVTSVVLSIIKSAGELRFVSEFSAIRLDSVESLLDVLDFVVEFEQLVARLSAERKVNSEVVDDLLFALDVIAEAERSLLGLKYSGLKFTLSKQSIVDGVLRLTWTLTQIMSAVKCLRYSRFISDDVILILPVIDCLDLVESGVGNLVIEQGEDEARELLRELEESGLVVECPVKGSVVYCEESSCVSCSD